MHSVLEDIIHSFSKFLLNKQMNEPHLEPILKQPFPYESTFSESLSSQ